MDWCISCSTIRATSSNTNPYLRFVISYHSKKRCWTLTSQERERESWIKSGHVCMVMIREQCRHDCLTHWSNCMRWSVFWEEPIRSLYGSGAGVLCDVSGTGQAWSQWIIMLTTSTWPPIIPPFCAVLRSPPLFSWFCSTSLTSSVCGRKWKDTHVPRAYVCISVHLRRGRGRGNVL